MIPLLTAFGLGGTRDLLISRDMLCRAVNPTTIENVADGGKAAQLLDHMDCKNFVLHQKLLNLSPGLPSWSLILRLLAFLCWTSLISPP